MNGAIIKFNALAYADRAGAENNDLFPIGPLHLVFVIVGGVIVGRNGLELARTGIDFLKGRMNAHSAAHISDLRFMRTDTVRDIAVAKPRFLHLRSTHSGRSSMV